MNRSVLTFSLAMALGACTAVTGAYEYKVDDTAFPRDFDYTFIDMSPHAAKAMDVGPPMDIALVDDSGFAQSRVRVYLPPKPASGAYPNVEVKLEQALWSGAYRMFFYIDDNDNYMLDTQDQARKKTLEHTWIEDVSASGVGSFTHSTNFKIFGTDDVQTIGKDVIIQLPGSNDGSALLRTCVSKALSSQFKDSLEVRVLITEAGGKKRQSGLFKTFPGVNLPREVKLVGIVDEGSSYTVEVVLDSQKTVREYPDVSGDIVLSPDEWLPVPSKTLLGCLGNG